MPKKRKKTDVKKATIPRLMSITFVVQRDVCFDAPADADEDRLAAIEHVEVSAWAGALEGLGWNTNLENCEPSEELVIYAQNTYRRPRGRGKKKGKASQ